MVTGGERSGIEDYLRARLGGAAARLELPSRRGARVVLQASPAELHVDDDAWKPEPHIDRPPEDRAEGEVSIGLGTEDEGVDVLVPEAGRTKRDGAAAGASQ